MIVLKQGNNGMEQRKKKKKNEKQIHDRVENKEL